MQCVNVQIGLHRYCTRMLKNLTGDMCLNLRTYFFRVSSLTYPNLLGKKSYVIVVVKISNTYQSINHFNLSLIGSAVVCRCKSLFTTSFNSCGPTLIRFPPSLILSPLHPRRACCRSYCEEEAKWVASRKLRGGDLIHQ